MSVIFAGVFSDCVAIGADTLAHDAANPLITGKRHKIRCVNAKVLAAKVGLGPSADGIWDDLKIRLGDGLADAGPSEVAAALRYLGPHYFDLGRREAIALRVENPGIFLLVVGWEADGTTGLHWLNFTLEDFGSAMGPGKCVAYGPEDSNAAAQALLSACLTAGSSHIMAPLDRWAIDVVAHCRSVAPGKVDFPADLELIDDRHNHIIAQLGPGNSLAPRFHRRISPRQR